MLQARSIMPADWIARGLGYRQRRQWKRAAECFAAAANEAPDQPLAWYYLAVTLDNRGQEAEAIPSYKRALQLGLDQERERNAWAWLGSSLRKTNQPEQALECFHRAEALEYPGAELHAFRGLALLAISEPQMALRSFDATLKLEPDNPTIWRLRYRALKRLKRMPEANAALVEAKRLEGFKQEGNT